MFLSSVYRVTKEPINTHFPYQNLQKTLKRLKNYGAIDLAYPVCRGDLYEVDVPENSCSLFVAVVLSYLLPVKDDNSQLKENYLRLFGKKVSIHFDRIRNLLLNYDIGEPAIFNDSEFMGIIKVIFRNKVIQWIVDKPEVYGQFLLNESWERYEQRMINEEGRGGLIEIMAISDILNCDIEVEGYPMDNDLRETDVKIRLKYLTETQHYHYLIAKQHIPIINTKYDQPPLKKHCDKVEASKSPIVRPRIYDYFVRSKLPTVVKDESNQLKVINTGRESVRLNDIVGQTRQINTHTKRDKPIRLASSNYQISIPPNTQNGLLWEVVLKYLAPAAKDENKFKKYFAKLFGDNLDIDLKHIRNLLQKDPIDINLLICEPHLDWLVNSFFRNEVILKILSNQKNYQPLLSNRYYCWNDYLQQLRDNHWREDIEIIAIRELINCHIDIAGRQISDNSKLSRDNIIISLKYFTGLDNNGMVSPSYHAIPLISQPITSALPILDQTRLEFYKAVQAGDIITIQIFLNQYPGLINYQEGPEKYSALHYAATYRTYHAIKLLLQNQCNVNLRTFNGKFRGYTAIQLLDFQPAIKESIIPIEQFKNLFATYFNSNSTVQFNDDNKIVKIEFHKRPKITKQLEQLRELYPHAFEGDKLIPDYEVCHNKSVFTIQREIKQKYEGKHYIEVIDNIRGIYPGVIENSYSRLAAANLINYYYVDQITNINNLFIDWAKRNNAFAALTTIVAKFISKREKKNTLNPEYKGYLNPKHLIHYGYVWNELYKLNAVLVWKNAQGYLIKVNLINYQRIWQLSDSHYLVFKKEQEMLKNQITGSITTT